MKGLHLIADLYGCQGELLRNSGLLEAWCVDACEACDLTVVTRAFHQFPPGPQGPGGATGAVVLAESHLAIHTWPELACVTLDLYVCNYSRDNRQNAENVLARLIEHLRPAHQEITRLTRGALHR